MEKTAFKTLQDIAAIPVPASTSYLRGYQAVPHIDVVNSIKEFLDKRNIGVSREVYKTGKEGNIMYGSILTDMKSDNDLGGGIHFVNSYDKSKKLEVRAGAVVFLCDNGMIRMHTMERVARKHIGTINFDLKPIVEHSIEMLEKEYNLLLSAKNTLQRITVSSKVRAELAGRLFMEHELLTVSQMSILKQQFDKTEGPFTDPTAWAFYNNVTETLKSSHPLNYITDHEEFHEMMVQEFHI